MTPQRLDTFLHRLRRVIRPEAQSGLTDAQLLERFAARQDEAAFEVLVWRHAAMVLGLARRLLRHEHDAEDVFQATFLILARKASSVRSPEGLAGWLYRIAHRLACRARGRAAPLGRLTDVPAPPAVEEAVWRDLRPVLDEEIDRLPEKYRLPVILCYLEGRTLAEASRQLGCPRGTIGSRLAEARARLGGRLTRRGVTLSAVGLSAALVHGVATAAPASLVAVTLASALPSAAGPAVDAVLTPAAVLAEGVFRAMFLTKLKIALVLLLGAGVAAAGAVAFARQKPGNDARPSTAELVAGVKDALRLPPHLPGRLGLQVSEVKERPIPHHRLRLAGTLAIDPDRLVIVRSRFAGEVMELGTRGEGKAAPLVRVGDRVKKGQLLAVIWSKDLAQKKAAYADAQVRLDLDQTMQARLEGLYKQGAVSEATLRDGERRIQVALQVATQAERTLRLWRLSEEEIQGLKDEAKGVPAQKGKPDAEREKRWARVEIRAPHDGTVVERNAVVGEVVDTHTVLFRVADLSTLAVWVRAPQDAGVALRALTPAQRRWTLEIAADPQAPPVEGRIERIAPSVDPKLRDLMLVGSVANPTGRLMPGQFVTATILLPAASDEVAIPATALVEVGKEFIVFVQPDPKKLVYVQRRVAVVRRGRDVTHVRAAVRPGEQGVEPLRPGERLVTAGALELQALLCDLEARPKR